MEQISPGVCVCGYCIRMVLEMFAPGEELSWWFVNKEELLSAEEGRHELIKIVDNLMLRQVAGLKIIPAAPRNTWIMTTNKRIFISEY